MDDRERFAAIRLARADFYFFSRWMFLQRRGFTWQRAPHHKTICEALTRVFKGECKRLIINIPPRYSKTELAVVNFMSWALGQCPDAEFIHTSYSGRLAGSNAWQARELVSSDDYREIFPATALRSDSQAKDEWRTAAGGCVYAVGAGGSITGYGAGKMRESFGGAIIIDDPHKPDEARSDVMRKNVIEWFQNTLESRKNAPNTPIILIMQRLHEEDLSGWLLEGGNGEKWEHINLPAIQADGTALWPEKHTLTELRRMETAAPYTFSGQYQQRPTPPEGGIFKPDKLVFCDDLKAATTWVRAWDLAATEDDGDWTVGALLGRTPDKRFISGDIVRLQGSPDQVERAIVSTAIADGTDVRISLPQDPGQAGKSQVAYLTRALAGFSVTSSLESGDKITRAEPFAAQVNVGNVSLLRSAEWTRSFIHEMRNFPFGKHDDQIDAMSRAFNFLMDATSMIVSAQTAADFAALARRRR
jgi:predicted phage terminase large subunit-like protein